MDKNLAIIVFSLSAMLSGAVYGNPIYKWTDAEGNVHFSDRPTGAESEERLNISSGPTNPARVQAEIQAREDAEAQAAEELANMPPGPTEEEQRAIAEERAQKCNMYSERHVRFTENRRLYRLDENGERIYYNEEEMQAARDNVQDLMTKYCS